MQMEIRTVGDFHRSRRRDDSGGPDYTAPLYDRMLNLIFDGKRLDEHAIETEKEAAKRLYEKEAIAYSLVGCNVDSEIAELRSACPPKSDFDAVLRGGVVVHVEVARLIDPAEKRYLSALDKITRRTAGVLGGGPGLSALAKGGKIVLRFYGDTPAESDISPAVSELADFLKGWFRNTNPSSKLTRVDERWPTLRRLDTYVGRDDYEGPARLVPHVMRIKANQSVTLAQFDIMVNKKKARFANYSEGKPVWLVFYSDTRLFFPLGLVEQLRDINTFDPRPFARVMLGCFTVGVVFEKPCTKPSYRSLSTS
jgi:hypothetical protein